MILITKNLIKCSAWKIADECGIESWEAVILSLKEHFSKHGTVSSDIDAWTRRRRKFIGNGLSWVKQPTWTLRRAIASCASLPVGMSVRAQTWMLHATIDNGYEKIGMRLQLVAVKGLQYAAHCIKIRARMQCAMCTFLVLGLRLETFWAGGWLLKKPAWATVFSVFLTIQGSLLEWPSLSRHFCLEATKKL